MKLNRKRLIGFNGLRNVHKWLGFLVGVQVLLWVTGGVVMSAIPIEIVRGNHLIERLPSTPDSSDVSTLSDIDVLIEWQSLEWINRAGSLALKVKSFDAKFQFLDPETGNTLKPISIVEAQRIAQSQYTGSGKVSNVELLEKLPQEVGHLKGQIARVSFDDWINTDFYIATDSAEVLSVRSDLWRFYDFFWMLHIMDYEYRENFNNWLVISAASVSLLFSVSGVLLLYMTLLRPKAKKYLRKLKAGS